MTHEITDDWDSFLKYGNIDMSRNTAELKNNNNYENIPKASELYISTKTKILFLNKPIDLIFTFWNIEIIPYNSYNNGVIKKQMKFISHTSEELQIVKDKLKNYKYYKQFIINHVEQHQSNIFIYKDSRKISIGISNKDLINERCKPKSAFYNCFVLIIRILHNDEFKEMHIKVFNTGKVEIPGVQDDDLFIKTLEILTNLLSTINSDKISYNPDSVETVLINSNFNCGFCINRPVLFNILKNKHNLNVSYDPCSYPGIQCKYSVSNSSSISFMIFRTGSILIVGKSEEALFYDVYNMIKDIIKDEYQNISENYEAPVKNKNFKKKRKTKILYN